MPELPDIEAYLEALRPRVVGERLLDVRLLNPFLLRTVDPPLDMVRDSVVRGVSRLGKRIVIEIAMPGSDAPHYLVIHLMIAGRLRWKPALPSAAPGEGSKATAGRGGTLAVFEFSSGTLWLTEAGSKRRASLHLVRGPEALAALDPGGIDVFSASSEEFAGALLRENRTLKRALTDPRLLSGIGNAYSDEILHRARLSPLKLTQSLSDDEMGRLRAATVAVLQEWADRLKGEARERFPEKVTAFRPEMAVHGKFGSSCSVVRSGGAAHRVRRQRVRLLPRLSDRRPHHGRPLAFPLAEGRLATWHARARGRFIRRNPCSGLDFP